MTQPSRPTLPHTKEAVADFHDVQAALRLWWRDFDRLLEYVEPVAAHQAVYSHRLFELLLRAATEFESFAKAYANHTGSKLPPRPTMVDYKRLLAPLRLAAVDVGIQQWRPRARYVTPFAVWAEPDDDASSPDWYKAYNSVKHSRRERFAKASLLNATTAAAGVFATLILAYDAPLWPPKGTQRHSASHPPQTVDLQFEDCPFTLRVPLGML